MDDWASRPSTPKAETRCDGARDHQQNKNTKRTIAIRLRRDGSSDRALDSATVRLAALSLGEDLCHEN
jgi:hypothetical protein